MNATLSEKIKELEKEAIRKALKECGWIQARAARKLGITERMINYKIKKYGIAIKEVTNNNAKVSSEDASNQSSSNNS